MNCDCVYELTRNWRTATKPDHFLHSAAERVGIAIQANPLSRRLSPRKYCAQNKPRGSPSPGQASELINGNGHNSFVCKGVVSEPARKVEEADATAHVAQRPDADLAAMVVGWQCELESHVWIRRSSLTNGSTDQPRLADAIHDGHTRRAHERIQRDLCRAERRSVWTAPTDHEPLDDRKLSQHSSEHLGHQRTRSRQFISRDDSSSLHPWGADSLSLLGIEVP